MFVILLSSAALAAEDPVQENHPRNKLLKLFDYGFTGIFALECTLKVFSTIGLHWESPKKSCFFQILDLGVAFHPGAYLRDIWNVMDSLVVSCALISFYFQWVFLGTTFNHMPILHQKLYRFGHFGDY